MIGAGGGKGPRQKGDRFERYCAALLTTLGVPAHRVPLSGSAKYTGDGGQYQHDLRVRVRGDDLPVECKDRQRAGLADFYAWLAEGPRYLFVRRSRDATLVVMTIEEFARLVAEPGPIIGSAEDWSVK